MNYVIWPKFKDSGNMKLLSLITLCVITSAHEITQLKVPLFADPRRPAVLSCHFQMDDQRLHSVKWYRDMNEIFRYNPSQKPPIRLFNVTDIMVQGGECQADSCMVKVMPPPVATRAAYTCEVSTEGPKFQIARQTKHMTVVAMPDLDPVIIGAPKVLKPGEQIFLNCTSDYSLPPSDINWYIDNELQKPEQWQRTELSEIQPGGLRRSWRVLRVRVPPTASGAIRVRCSSVLMVEPPVVRDTVAIITVNSRTQHSKYVSNNKDEYYNDNPQIFPRQTSMSPTSDIEVPIVYDSDSSASHQGVKSVVASADQPNNINAITLEPEPSNKTTVEQIGTNSVPANITPSDPGPSTSVDVPSLPSEVLEALGDPKGKEEVFGPKIPDEIAKRWGRVLVDGLTKELKQDLMEKALIPENFRLAKAPLLNAEVLPVLNDAAKHRDKQMEKYQNQLGRGISGLTNLASSIIEGNTDKIDLLKKLSETSQILLDLHYEETKRRRKLVTASLDKKFLGMISDVKRDEFLFGNNLNDKIKASKTAERSGLQIKRTDTNTAAAFRKYPQQGNWRGPPRAQAARTYKQGAQRNRYIPQPNRRPPPNQDRQSRLPTKSNSNTKTRKT